MAFWGEKAFFPFLKVVLANDNVFLFYYGYIFHLADNNMVVNTKMN